MALMLALYDFLTKRHRAVTTLPDQPVTLYLCGPTVYGPLHIGNFRSVFNFDVLYRFWQRQGKPVKYYQNITDIDDKIIAAAKTQGISEATLTEQYYQQYLALCQASNLQPPIYVKVTDHILTIINFIQQLIANHQAYLTTSGVYFATTQAADYGKLRKLGINQPPTVATLAVTKRHHQDFALWKLTTLGKRWDSPWGPGRPGWHTECAALIAHCFNQQTLSIHGGGRDLCFPHHENERIQFQAVVKRPLTAFWLHSGLVQTATGKISRSQGIATAVNMRAFLAQYGHNVLRLFFFSRPYYKDLTFDLATIQSYQTVWQRWQQLWITLHRHFVLQPHSLNLTTTLAESVWTEFDQLLADNLGVDRILTLFFTWEKTLNLQLQNQLWSNLAWQAARFWQGLTRLGFQPTQPVWTAAQRVILQQWQQAIQQRDFRLADQLRAQLSAANLW